MIFEFFRKKYDEDLHIDLKNSLKSLKKILNHLKQIVIYLMKVINLIVFSRFMQVPVVLKVRIGQI